VTRRLVLWRAQGNGQTLLAEGVPAGETDPGAERLPTQRYQPRDGSVLAVTIVCLTLVTRVSTVIADGLTSQVPVTVALFVLPVLYAASGTRRLVSRHRWMALAVQAALTVLAFAIFATGWQIGVDGLLAGLVLLVLPSRVSWLVAGALLAAEVAVRVLVTGLPSSPTWYGVVAVAAYYVDDALAFFAPVRLAQIVEEVVAARDTARGLAVATERLDAARSLRTAVGDQMAEISVRTSAARKALRGNTALARAEVSAAGIAARDAVARVRAVSARQLDAVGPGLADRPADRRAVMGARLAWVVLVAVLSVVAIENTGFVATSHDSAQRKTLAIGIIVLAMALQLYHSSAARNGQRARWWPLSLALQTVLAYAFLFPFVHAYVGFLGPLVAGSVLLLLPGWWRWAGYAAVVTSYSLLYALDLPAAASPGGQLLPNIVFAVGLSAELGLLFYGLAWLASLALQLDGLTGQLARMAVVQERLRIARDLHDLLGLGLSAIALKADLVNRLIGSDRDRADAEIGELARICAATRAEIRGVTGDGQRLSLADELVAARQILLAAGIEVRVTITGEQQFAAANDVLAPVLREAVTNVLRHSAAKTCLIQAAGSAGGVSLQVVNDGVTTPPPARQASAANKPGRGLINLAARLEAAGGRFTSGLADGQFHVSAELAAPGAARQQLTDASVIGEAGDVRA
jgi:two-component system, NarL family, sensor histidine kinase DesK